ncbi:MAG TPA: prolyl oligopeptidase family serine peptidase [Pyrinomonadaceae bacterium]|nr:prolyl oligopeptidase family serine peptidase [Pyrinomonadaceae bacterium]
MLYLQHPNISQARQRNPVFTKLFSYDRSASFDLKETATTERDGVIIRDVTYAACDPRHKRIEAYVVRPSGKGRFAGVVFFHWLGNVKSDRTEFLDEAVALAKQGTVSILIQGYFPWLEAPAEPLSDRRQIIDQTIEVRRALDLLLKQPQVDAKRIAFVGHDYGAMFGGIVAGIEKRFKVYVLMAGLGNFSDWSLKYWPVTANKGEGLYRQTMLEVDPIGYVPKAAPARLLFQFSNKDKFIPRAAALEYFEAASEPKQIKWYDAVHDLNVDAARSDRREWLAQQLHLHAN